MDSDVRELTEDDLELIAFSRSIVQDNSDGDIHTVRAAVRDNQGQMHGGINVYHFNGGPCAELVALGAARANGARQVVTIVAVGDGGRGLISPCGRDRQVLLDYHPTIRVVLPTADGDRSVPVESPLPFGYHWAPQD